MTSRKRHRSWFRTGRSWTWLARSSSEALHGRGASDAARREPRRARRARSSPPSSCVRARRCVQPVCSRAKTWQIFFSRENGAWEGSAASPSRVRRPRKRRRVAARPSQTRAARARAMIRGTSRMRGVIHVACALALALACSPTRARAQPLHRKPTPRARPVSTRPTHTGWWRLPPRGHLPARRARARPRPRSRRRYGRRRARAPSRGARSGRFRRRGPPRAPGAGVSGREGEERRRRIFFPRTRRTLVFELSLERTLRGRRLRSAHDRSRESLALPDSRSRRARAAVFTRPPADVHVFRSVHVRAPLGVLLRAGSFEGRSERSSAADRRAFASAADRRAVASAVTARRGAVRRPAGWLHVRRLAGRRRPLRLVCVRGRRSELLLRRGVRHRLRRLLRGQEELLRREKGRSAVRGEARADFRGENRGVGETRVDSFARSNSIRRKKTKNKKTTSDAGFSFF